MTTEAKPEGQVVDGAAEQADRADPVGTPQEFTPAPSVSPRAEILKRLSRQAEAEQGHNSGVGFDDSGDEPKLVRTGSTPESKDNEIPALNAAKLLADAGAPVVDAGATEAAAAETAAIVASEATPAESKPTGQVAKIKVFGEEKEVPIEQVIAAGVASLQKESAADVRLREASALHAEAQALFAQARQGAQPAQATREAQPTQDEAIAIANAIASGDRAASAQAIQHILNRGANPQAVEQVVQRNVAAHVADILSHRDAVKQLEADLPDIKASPMVQQFAATEERRLRMLDSQNGINRSYAEVYSDVAKTLKAFRGVPAQSAPASTLQARQEAKANAPAAVVGAAAVPASNQTKRPPTARETISSMQRQRMAGSLQRI
jgi:hypothetical protein